MNSKKRQDEYSSDRPLEVGDCVVEWLDSDCLMEGCIRAIEPCELIGQERFTVEPLALASQEDPCIFLLLQHQTTRLTQSTECQTSCHL